MPTRCISLDTETTGLDRENSQVLEVGAVAFDLFDPLPDHPSQYDDARLFRRLVDPGEIKGEAYALSMHPELLKEIATTDGLPSAYKAFDDLKVWVEDDLGWGEDGVDDVVLVGKQLEDFDLRFAKREILRPYRERTAEVNYHPERYWSGWKFWHRRVFDLNGFLTRPGDSKVPGLSTQMERAGLEMTDGHRALGDAYDTAQLAQYVTALQRYGQRAIRSADGERQFEFAMEQLQTEYH